MAYRVLVNRTVHGEEAWLAARRDLVTASESAHLMGKANPYWAKSEQELAAEKKDGRQDSPSPLMLAGTFWENPILEYLGECAGLDCRPSSALYGSLDFPWMGATPDGTVALREPPGPLSDHLTVQYGFDLTQGEEATQVLRELVAGSKTLVEVKNQRSKDRSKWNKPEGGPAWYENQVHHQLAVLDDYELGLLVAKVDANELYVHVIERDPLYVELLVDVCRQFASKYLTEA